MLGKSPMKYLNPTPDYPTWDETTFVWNITNWSKLNRREYSPEFEAAGVKWRVLLYPNGDKQNGLVSAYLYCVSTTDPDWIRCASFAIAIARTKNHDVSNVLTLNDGIKFTISSPGRGWNTFGSINSLKSSKILEKGTCSVIRVFRVDSISSKVSQTRASRVSAWALEAAELGLKIHVSPAVGIRMDNLNFNVPSNQLKDYVNSPVFADVELELNVYEFREVIQKTFFAHKKTLSASSKYFDAMFNNDSAFKESSEFTIKIQLPVSLYPAEVLLLLTLVYTASKDHILIANTIECGSRLLRLAMVAEYLQMESLLDLLCNEMLTLITGNLRSLQGMEETILSHDLVTKVLKMAEDKQLPLRKSLEWIDMTLTSQGQSLGWDTTPEGLKQVHDLIATFIVPRGKELPFLSLPDTFRGLSEKLISFIPMNVIMPSILSR